MVGGAAGKPETRGSLPRKGVDPVPAPRNSVPSYRLHKQSGQAVVTLRDSLTGQRRDVMLGEHDSPESRAEYKRVVLEWESNGRRPSPATETAPDVTVNEILVAFWAYAETYYRDPDGNPTLELDNYKYALRPLKALYGHTPVADLDQRALKAIRQRMIDDGLARGNINSRIGKIRRVVKWAAEEQLAPASVHHALATVSGLKQGRSQARETEPVKPVARTVVDHTLSHLTATVAAMVRLQLETGMRPGEMVIMRACDIDMAGKVWLYRPARHKNLHRGHERIIPIGPKAQAIIRQRLRPDTQAYLFTPADAMREQGEQKRQNRQTPLWPAHLEAQERKRQRSSRRSLGARYEVHAYALAVKRACDQAFTPPDHLCPTVKANGKRETRKEFTARLPEDEKAELREWRKAHRWHPHQLRHTRALELKREAGLDVARAVLGHRSPVITEHYATLDIATAAEAMAKLG
jgi:integrase